MGFWTKNRTTLIKLANSLINLAYLICLALTIYFVPSLVISALLPSLGFLGGVIVACIALMAIWKILPSIFKAICNFINEKIIQFSIDETPSLETLQEQIRNSTNQPLEHGIIQNIFIRILMEEAEKLQAERGMTWDQILLLPELKDALIERSLVRFIDFISDVQPARYQHARLVEAPINNNEKIIEDNIDKASKLLGQIISAEDKKQFESKFNLLKNEYKDYCCPISFELPADPVRLKNINNNQCYERANLVQLITPQKGTGNCPVTQGLFKAEDIIPYQDHDIKVERLVKYLQDLVDGLEAKVKAPQAETSTSFLKPTSMSCTSRTGLPSEGGEVNPFFNEAGEDNLTM